MTRLPNGMMSKYLLSQLMDHTREVQGQRMCDLACGQGQVAWPLAVRGASVVGIDLSQRLLEIARQQAATDGQPIVYQHDDAQEGFWRPADGPGVRGRVGAHHRTLSTYLNTIIEAGVCVERPDLAPFAITQITSNCLPPCSSLPQGLIRNRERRSINVYDLCCFDSSSVS